MDGKQSLIGSNGSGAGVAYMIFSAPILAAFILVLAFLGFPMSLVAKQGSLTRMWSPEGLNSGDGLGPLGGFLHPVDMS